MSLKLYRPTPDGLEAKEPPSRDWRTLLRSRRWEPARLENPEADVTSPLAGVLFFVGLAVATFALLLLGYGTGFWG
jgi:hypothetical protein